MTRTVSIIALIIAIVLTMMGTANAQKGTDPSESPASLKREANTQPLKTGVTVEKQPAEEGSMEQVQEPYQPELTVQDAPPVPECIESNLETCTKTVSINSESTDALERVKAELSSHLGAQYFVNCAVLCFEFHNGPLVLDFPLIIASSLTTDEGGNHVIYGLELAASPNFPEDEALIYLASNGKGFTLRGWSLSNARNGLVVRNAPAMIHKSVFRGRGDQDSSGVCLELSSSDNSIVTDSQFIDCAIAIQTVNSNNVRLGAENEELFDRHKNTIYNFYSDGIVISAGDQNLYPYNLISSTRTPPQEYSTRAIKLQREANAGITSPEIVLQTTPEGKKLVDCSNEGFVNVMFSELSGEIVWYRPTDGTNIGYLATCSLQDGLCILPLEVFESDQCNCLMIERSKALYTTEKRSSTFVNPIDCQKEESVVTPTTDAGGVVIATPAPSADEPDVDVSSLAAGAAGGCGKSASSLVANNIASTHAPALGLWWMVFAAGIVLGIRGRVKRFQASRKRREEKGR